MNFYNTLTPYRTIEHKYIQYGTCRDFNHISRYNNLRQVTHAPEYMEERFVTLEIPNTITCNVEVDYYEVPLKYENRLDLIAHQFLGSSTYSWIIAYINEITDGYTVREGTIIKIPKSIYSLFNSGELLAPITALSLNLGTE